MARTYLMAKSLELVTRTWAEVMERDIVAKFASRSSSMASSSRKYPFVLGYLSGEGLGTMKKLSRPTELRRSGIGAVGDIPWATHFCHFYQTKNDLLEILIPYFKAGLEDNELCVWVAFDPLCQEEIRAALEREMPEAKSYFESNQIEVFSHSSWYLRDGVLDVPAVMEAWMQKLDEALSRGFDGLRVNGNEAWLTEKDWDDFIDYECRLNGLIKDRKIIVMCTYPLENTKATDIFDAARTHQFSIARRFGDWEVLETPALVEAKGEIKKLNRELEGRVVERTSQLADANNALTREVAERRQAEVELRKSGEQLRALSARLESMREEERTRISRQVHDELGQKLTVLKMELHGMEERLEKMPDGELRADLENRVVEASELADETITAVQSVASQLRSPVLDSLGLIPALRYEATQFQVRSKIKVVVDLPEESPPVNPVISTVVYRIFQEILTNVARHADAREVRISLQVSEGRLRLRVRDNGRGLADGDLTKPSALGWLGMSERAASVRGNLTAEATHGGGATMILDIPLPDHSGKRSS